MTKQLKKGDCVTLSPEALSQGIKKQCNPDRIGTIVGVGRSDNYLVQWDGTKQGVSIADSFVIAIKRSNNMAANKQAGVYTSYQSWKRGLRLCFPGFKIEGNKDIAQAYIINDVQSFNPPIAKRKFVGEWDGAVGSINKQEK